MSIRTTPKYKLYVTDDVRIMVTEPQDGIPGTIKLQLKGTLNYAFLERDDRAWAVDEESLRYHRLRHCIDGFLDFMRREIEAAFNSGPID